MLNWRAAALAAATILCCLWAASAEIGDVSYGPWTAWTQQPIENKTNLFVDTRLVLRPAARSAWRYTRYAFTEEGVTRYVAWQSEAPDATRQEIERDQPLDVIGVAGGHTVYKGGWFNQQALTLHDDFAPVTQYRAREIYLTACAIEPAALVMAVGEHVQLGIHILDDSAYSLTGDNPDVLWVDPSGLVSALAPGRTKVSLICGAHTAVCEVLVVSEDVALKAGAAAVRLAGTRLTLCYSVGKKEIKGLSLALEAEKAKSDPEKRVLISDPDGGVFSMRALCARIAYLGAPLSDEGAVQSGEARFLMLKDVLERQKEIRKLEAQKVKAAASGMPTAQPGDETVEYAAFMEEGGASHRFRAIRTLENDLILCLQADNQYALTASKASEGAALSIEKLDLGNPLQRWTLEVDKSGVEKDSVWRLPIADNSFCQITDDFKTMARDGDKHDGVDFSPTGNKDVVAVSSGRVVRVDDRCTHDYRKTKKNKYGRYIDPCDLADGIISKYGSYGKYIVIEHADGTRSMYAHLSKILVRSGQTIKRGQLIGIMGSTGSANGTHLHFEARVSNRAADPRYFLELPEIGGYVP